MLQRRGGAKRSLEGRGRRGGLLAPVQGARGEGKTVKQKLAIKLRYFLVSKKNRVSLCLCLFSERRKEREKSSPAVTVIIL